MLSRENFNKLLSALAEQEEYDINQSHLLGKAFPNAFEANLIYDNSILIKAIKQYLKESFNDVDKWIEWFIDETDYGRNGSKIRCTYEDGTHFWLTNSDELYDFLVDNYKLC